MTKKAEPAGAGAKPDLAWLAVTQCHVDRRYQRAIASERSQALILRIASDFRWAAFQAVLAAPDGRGGYAILDGQHRVEAARRCGVTHVPAVVVAAASLAEQALAFVRANQDRVVVNPFALFHAKIVAGDPEAIAIKAICDRAAVVIPRYTVQRKNMKPGETMALGSIALLRRQHGDELALLALKSVAYAWSQHRGDIRAPIVRAMGAVLASDGDAGAAAQRLVQYLAMTSPKALAQAMRRRRETAGGTEASAYETVLRRALEQHGPAQTSVPPAAPLPDVAPVPTKAGSARAGGARSPAEAERAAIDRHVRTRGVTKCPPAYAAPVEGARPVGPLPHHEPPSWKDRNDRHKARARSGKAAAGGAD